MVKRGQIWWTSLPKPTGSEAGFDRPSVVVQDDVLTRSDLRTVLVVPLTSTLDLVGPITNVLLRAKQTGLTKDSVAVTSLITHVNKSDLKQLVGKVTSAQMSEIELGMATALGMTD